MARNRILIDSSFLYSLFSLNSRQHKLAVSTIALDQGSFVVPQVVLTEVAYLFHRTGGSVAVAGFIEHLVALQIPLETLTPLDLQRARAIMLEYHDAQFDFVDCCLMALAERLKIKQICTFDQRDFSIYRPQHSEYLELLP